MNLLTIFKKYKKENLGVKLLGMSDDYLMAKAPINDMTDKFKEYERFYFEMKRLRFISYDTEQYKRLYIGSQVILKQINESTDIYMRPKYFQEIRNLLKCSCMLISTEQFDEICRNYKLTICNVSDYKGVLDNDDSDFINNIMDKFDKPIVQELDIKEDDYTSNGNRFNLLKDFIYQNGRNVQIACNKDEINGKLKNGKAYNRLLFHQTYYGILIYGGWGYDFGNETYKKMLEEQSVKEYPVNERQINIINKYWEELI